MVENQIAKMSMSVKATEIALAKFHQYVSCALGIPCILPVVGFCDRI